MSDTTQELETDMEFFDDFLKTISDAEERGNSIESIRNTLESFMFGFRAESKEPTINEGAAFIGFAFQKPKLR